MSDTPLRWKVAVAAIATDLLDTFGSTLVAYMANVRTRNLPKKWADGDVLPGKQSLERLCLASRVLALVRDSDGPDVARAWMIGANPRFDDAQSPAERIRALDNRAVLGAAQAMAEGQEMGS